MTELPSGTVTVLFTDIESSTRRWELRPDEMRESLVNHDDILYGVVQEFGGHVFKHTGDGVAAVFTIAAAGVDAAVEIQRRLQTEAWSGDDRLKVRIGLHTGDAEPRGGDYFGPAINRAARVMDIANGDQITLSGSTSSLATRSDVVAHGEHQLKGLGSEHISLVRAEGLIVDERPLRTRTAAVQSGLPVVIEPLVARTAEIEQLTSLLVDNRLVTMVGVGGVGKTRLAVEVASRIADRFPDGIVFCELAKIDNEVAVVDAMAQAIGAKRQPGLDLAESIAHFVEGREILVLVDNCEHVIDSVRDVIRRVLTVDGPTVLCTSREPMRIAGEHVVPVAPLDAATDGIELFIERAVERDASFTADEADRDSIRRICEAVDGIPLAIELAAARVRVLGPAELLDRLDDRFRVLRGSRDGSRHATLLDTVRWSYEQLDVGEARLFDRLSVFAGGCTLSAIEAVCADDDFIDLLDVMDMVEALVDKSMLVREAGVGRVRFRMLETLRQFGRDSLAAAGDAEVFRERHRDHFTSLAAAQAAIFFTPKEAEVWETLGHEWANIRVAIESCLAVGDVDTAVDATLDLCWYGVFSMTFEVFAIADRLLALDGIDSHPRYPALLGASALHAYFTVDDRAADLAADALERDESEPTGLAHAALAAVFLNNLLQPDDSDRLTQNWLDRAEAQTTPALAWSHGMRAFHLGTYTDDPAALDHAERVAAIAAETSSASAAALAGWALGMAHVRSDPVAADAHWRAGLDQATSLAHNHLLTHLINGLRLHMMAGRGDLAVVCGLCRDELTSAMSQHYLAGTSHLFGVAGICLARGGRADAAATLLATMVANGHQPRSNARRALTHVLGDAAEAATAAGAALSVREGGRFAVEQLGIVVDELAEAGAE